MDIGLFALRHSAFRRSRDRTFCWLTTDEGDEGMRVDENGTEGSAVHTESNE